MKKEKQVLEAVATVTEAKKDNNLLSFFGEDKKSITHTYLIPATENGTHAKVSFKSIYSKASDRMGIVVRFGETGKESVIWASTNKLGRLFQTTPATKETTDINEPIAL